MTPLIDCGAFMDGLEVLGVAFTLDGDRLAITAPPGVLTAEQRAELSRHKEAIERLVRSVVTPWGQTSPASTPSAAVQLTMEAA